jgi:molybdate-binding protein
VAGLLDLDFLPTRWERFDLLISKDVFFSRVVQLFLNLVHDKQFFDIAGNLQGYDLYECGRIIFPKETSDWSSLEK